MNLAGKTVLITGATGSFGRTLIRKVLERHDVAAIRAFSRDELKQSELRREVDDSRLRLLLGDVRDLERLRIATRGVDVIFHAAALKQVDALEYNPSEACRTNIEGTQNLITAATENAVGLTVGLSTDKAVNPVNLYGATKLVAERLIAQAGVYSQTSAAGFQLSRFGAVRYGNVVGSRGSVVPIFREQAKSGTVTITDERMTRFWLTLDDAVEFVLSSLGRVRDGEVFVPKIPSARIVDVATAIAPDAEVIVTGVRPGEKIHECLLTEDESRNARDLGDRYAILPHRTPRRHYDWKPVDDGFRYSSDGNDHWLFVDDIRELVGEGISVR